MSNRGKRFLASVALLGLLVVPPKVWAIDQNAQNLQSILVFRNVSGAATTSGTALVLAFGDSRTTTGSSFGVSSTMGMDVTTTTVANSRRFVGIQADDSCPDGQLCRVITQGPALSRFAGSTANTYGINGSGDPVGTSTVSGQLGVGSRAGVILSNCVAGVSDNCLRWVYVQPNASSP